MFKHSKYVLQKFICQMNIVYCCGLLFSVIKVDEFTRQLWNIYETVRREGIAQVKFYSVMFLFIILILFLLR